jgi:hypothetical protein
MLFKCGLEPIRYQTEHRLLQGGEIVDQRRGAFLTQHLLQPIHPNASRCTTSNSSTPPPRPVASPSISSRTRRYRAITRSHSLKHKENLLENCMPSIRSGIVAAPSAREEGQDVSSPTRSVFVSATKVQLAGRGAHQARQRAKYLGSLSASYCFFSVGTVR